MDDNCRLLAFDNDFKFLNELKLFLRSTLQKYSQGKLEWTEDELRAGVHTVLADGRNVRIVLPKNKAETLKLIDHVVLTNQEQDIKSSTDQGVVDNGKCLNFVGFIGFSRPQKETSEEFTKKLWDFDRELIGELPRQKYIIAYVSGEREHGGNWGNLVLCNSPEAIEEWKAFHYHSRAITEISPQAYTHIRIHRGTLQEGLASDKFRVTQTIFLDYGAKCTGKFVSRKVEIWATGESSDYLETEL